MIVTPRRQGDPAILLARADMARKLLNWNPRYLDMEEIIETAWRWHARAPQVRGAASSGRHAPAAGLECQT
jgi:UDP-glucose 4-epimerase